MSFYQKVHRFMNAPVQVKGMYAEAYVYLAWGRILKLLPFHKVAPTLGEKMKETPHTNRTDQELQLLRTVSRAVHAMSRFTWWESQCLVKAIAAMKMLERRGIPSTLYLGSARNNEGQMVAHAWLRSGSYIVTGKEGHEKYTVVGIFGNGMGAEGYRAVK